MIETNAHPRPHGVLTRRLHHMRWLDGLVSRPNIHEEQSFRSHGRGNERQVKVSQSKLSEIADCQNVQIAPVFRIYFFGRLMDGLEHCVKTREILGFRHSRSMCRALGQSLSFNKKTNFEHAIIAEKPHGVSHVIEAARTVGKSQCHD